MLGDLNARVGNEIIGEIVGQHGMPGRNESGKRLELCAEQELVVGNSWFKKNYVFKYLWLRMAELRKGGRQGIYGLCVLTKRMLGRLRCESVEICGGMSPFFGGSSTEIGGWMEECREDGVCEKCVEGE